MKKVLLYLLLMVFPRGNFAQLPLQVDSAYRYIKQQYDQYHIVSYVYDDDNAGGNIFIPAIYEGKISNIDVKQDTINVFNGRSSTRFIFPLGTDTLFSTVKFVYPDQNIGQFEGYNMQGATNILFCVKGSGVAEFYIGGDNRKPWHVDSLPHQDGMDIRSSGFINLDTTWKIYSIPLNQNTFWVYLDSTAGLNNKYCEPMGIGEFDSIKFYYGAYDNLCDCHAMKAHWSGGYGWSGFIFFPAGLTWSSTQGYDLTGITKIKFKARITVPGNVKIIFGKTNDSSGQIASIFTFTTSWEWYDFTLPQNVNYSNIIGGFGFVFDYLYGTPGNSTLWIDSVYYEGHYLASNYDSLINGFTVTAGKWQNNDTVKIFLDKVFYNKERTDQSRLCLSTICSNDTTIDLTLKNTSFSYDNALKIITEIALFNATQDNNYLQDAYKTANAFIWAIQHDRYFSFRLRNAYSSGDIWLHVNDSTARLPGWYDEIQKKWFEDASSVSTSTGNVAWVALSLMSAFETSGDTLYRHFACRLAKWCIDSVKMDFGFTGGFEGFEGNQNKVLWKSTEHNLDLYSLFNRCFFHTQDSLYFFAAQNAHNFVMAMWDSTDHHFWTGTDLSGIQPNKTVVPLDAQSWYILAFQDSTSTYAQGCYQWAQDSLYEDNYISPNYATVLKGYHFSNKGDSGIWCEGSGQMAIVNNKMGHPDIANALLESLEYMQSHHLHPKFYNFNYKGIPAADHNHLWTGYTWEYSNRLALAPTCWYILAKLNYNPLIMSIPNTSGFVYQPGAKIYPNPFTKFTNIVLNDPNNVVVIHVFDETGRLIDQFNTSGSSCVKWEPVVSGIYFLNILWNNQQQITLKAICIK